MNELITISEIKAKARLIDSDDFKISKFNHHSALMFIVVIISCLCAMSYFIVDCITVDGLSLKTLVSRLVIACPLLIWILLYKCLNFDYVKDIKIAIVSAYIMCHLVIIFAMYSICQLPTMDTLCESLIIIQFMFLCLGMCSPFVKFNILAQSVFLLESFIVYLVKPFPDPWLVFCFNIPLFIGVIFIYGPYNDTCKMHYLREKQMEFSLGHDPLTKTYNKSYFDKIEDIAGNSKFMSYGLLVVDLDDFKEYVETYDHKTCDNLLYKIADVLREHTRFSNDIIAVPDNKSDYIFRWSDDSFVIVLPDIEKDGLLIVSDRIKRGIDDCFYGPIQNVKMSMGAVLSYGSEAYDSAIKRACSALYKSKNCNGEQIYFD